jgi:tetratricopeptide (TPR) repeat protein
MARAKVDQAWATQQLGNPNEARALNEDAERLYSAAGDQRGIARVLIQRGAGLRAAGRLDEAADTLKRALGIVQRLGNRSQTAGAANDLASVSFRQGRISEALTYYRQATALYAETGNRKNEAIGLGNVASMEYELGQVGEALKSFGDAIAIKRKLGDRRGTAITLGNMAEASSDNGELAHAEQLYSESISISREIGNQSEMAYGMAAQAAVFVREGRLDDALASLKSALDMQTRIDEAGDARDTQIAIAQVLLEKGDLLGAQTAAQQLLRDGVKNTPDVEAAAHAVLASLCTRKGDMDAAAHEIGLALAVDWSTLTRSARFSVGLSAGELYTRTQHIDEARALLGRLRDATRDLFAYRLMADYVDSLIRQATQDPSAKDQLAALAARAEAHGFRLIAERARHAGGE